MPRTSTVQGSQTPSLLTSSGRHTDEGPRERALGLRKPEAWLGAPGSACLSTVELNRARHFGKMKESGTQMGQSGRASEETTE